MGRREGSMFGRSVWRRPGGGGLAHGAPAKGCLGQGSLASKNVAFATGLAWRAFGLA